MLMLAASGVRVFEHIEEQLKAKPKFVVLKPVYEELVKLASSEQSLIKKRASFALELVRRFCELVDYPCSPNMPVDDVIIKYALEEKAIVATNDKELRAKLRKLGIPQAYLREEAMRVVVEGYL